LILSLSTLLCSCPCDHRLLHSFPTRRSSDLSRPLSRSPTRAGSCPRERGRTPRTFLRMRAPSSPRLFASAPSRSSVSSPPTVRRSEEHTSELQSRENLVCRLLLEKKKS